MELETMFTEQKWNILKCLSENKYSPLQLAERLDTTMANISQQLKLLEATNLVKKEKIRNRDKGKPRTLFSLRQDQAYLISAVENFTDKKLLRVNEHHKIILRIWFLEDQKLNRAVEKVYWKLRSDIDEVESIFVNTDSREIFVVTDSERISKKFSEKNRYDNLRIISKSKSEKNLAENKNAVIIYDSDNKLLKEGKRKKLLNA